MRNRAVNSIVVAVASCLVLLLALATVAPAQVAVRCMCYCGEYIFPPCSEEACKAACHWDPGGGSRGGESGPAQIFYCRAVAPDGSWGWAYDPRESRAAQQALAGCRKHADGCRLEACRINDPSLAQAPPATAIPPPPPQDPATPEAGWCALCVRKLQADIDSGWASGLIRIYVGQAIAGYENCKRKAGGVCLAGDQMAERLRNCGGMFDEYRKCLTRATQLPGGHY